MKATLEAFRDVLGNRKIVLARELTKIHEEFIRSTIEEVLEKEEYKGEFVILLEGAEESKQDIELKSLNELSLKGHYEKYEKEGFEKKEIIKKIAKDRNVSKNEIYQYFIEK